MKTKTQKTVKDVDGKVLLLQANRLIEDHVGENGGSTDYANNDWAAKFSDIRKTALKGVNDETGLRIYETFRQNGRNVYSGYKIKTDFEFATTRWPGRIGCRQFDYANFRKILAAAGIHSTVKLRAKAAKAGV